jgi:hypothetical protein
MGKSGRAITALLVSAFMAVASSAMAQDKGAKAAGKKGEPQVKVYYENDAVRVFEVTYKPGDGGPAVERPLRVIRVLKGGTLSLAYPDGKKEKLQWKTGEVRVREATPAYAVSNQGKSDVQLYVVYVKGATKK